MDINNSDIMNFNNNDMDINDSDNDHHSLRS